MWLAIRLSIVTACLVLSVAVVANDDRVLGVVDSSVEQTTADRTNPVEAEPTEYAPVCGGKIYCKDMQTCAEAVHYLEDCGVGRLDADNDGIPCETICGKTKGTMSSRIRAQPFLNNAVNDAPEELTLLPEMDESEFTCSGKRTCKQMTSCEEARFYLQKCGVRSLDGNSDGVPCNGLCR